MDQAVGAGVAGSVAAAAVTLSQLLDSVPDEWGPAGAAVVGGLWFVWRLHAQALTEIKSISTRLGEMHTDATGLRERVEANTEWIRELRTRTHSNSSALVTLRGGAWAGHDPPGTSGQWAEAREEDKEP